MAPAPTPLFRRAVIPYLDDSGFENYMMDEYDGDARVSFGFALPNETIGIAKNGGMYVFVTDLSKRLPTDEKLRESEGFRMSVPGVAWFPEGFDAARMVNGLNSSRELHGTFTASEEFGFLNFELKTIVPKGSAAPEHVEVAFEIVMNTAVWLFRMLRDMDLNADDWEIGDLLNAWPPIKGDMGDDSDDWNDDWDIEDILKPRTPV